SSASRYVANVCNRGVDDIAVLQSDTRRRCVRVRLVKHADGTTTDGHLPNGRYILPIEIHTVGDEITMTVDYINISEGSKCRGRSSSQRDTLDSASRSSVGREEVSPPYAVHLSKDDVTELHAGLGVQQDFLTGDGVLGGSPDAGRGGIVVREIEVA